MSYCNQCGTQIAEGSKFCPSCGTPAGAPAAPENRQGHRQAQPHPGQAAGGNAGQPVGGNPEQGQQAYQSPGGQAQQAQGGQTQQAQQPQGQQVHQPQGGQAQQAYQPPGGQSGQGHRPPGGQSPDRQAQQAAGENADSKLSAALATPDTTAAFSPADIEQNKVMALLSYLSILVLIPLLAAKESPFARYHANQGLLLCIASLIYGAAYTVLSTLLLAISWRLYFVVSLLGLAGVVFLILAILGILNALNGRAKELPLIGRYRILR